MSAVLTNLATKCIHTPVFALARQNSKISTFPSSLGIVALWWRELHIRHNHWLCAAIYCSVKQYKVRVIISIYRAAVFVSGETLQYWRWSWRSQIRPHTHCSSCQLTAIIICWPHTETLPSLYRTQTHKRHMYVLSNKHMVELMVKVWSQFEH